MLKITLLKIRIALWSILLLVVIFFSYKGFVPIGRLFFSHNFIDNGVYVGKLDPKDRFRIKGDEVNITGNPIYFNLRTLRDFKKLDFTLIYKNKDFPLVEAGILMDGKNWSYQLEPLENKIIDQLINSSDWDIIRDNNIILLQRNKKYDSISEFLDNPASREELVLYNYDLKNDYLLGDYASLDTEQKIGTSFRGSYEFFTYIKDEDLSVDFIFQDINQNKDEDAIEIYLYYQDKIIQTWQLDDDGISSDTGVESEEREMELKVAGLPEGVYKLGVKVNDDIITKEIKTKQSKISFLNNIHIYSKENDKIYTDSSKISVKIKKPQNLQKIIIKNPNNPDFEKSLEVKETYKKFEVSLEPGNFYELLLEKDDLFLSGDGSFSFSQESFLNPRLKKISPELDVQNSGINYVLADYNPPIIDGDWTIAQTSFNLERAYIENDNYSFILSIPGLRAEDNIDDSIIIKEARFNLLGSNFTEIFKNFFN